VHHEHVAHALENLHLLRGPMAPSQLFQPRVVRDDESDAPNVLLVDDIDANLIALEAALSSLRCNLMYARSGSEALAHLLREDVALILMDVQMPEMDGYETARLVRARRKTQHVPIIFLTAHDCGAGAIKRAYDLGAVDFLPKPLDVDVLRAKAQAFIALHERTLEVAELRAERAIVEERARQEAQALERDMERLAESDRRKTELLAMLASELRTPLAPVQRAMDELRQTPSDPRLLDIVQAHLDDVSRLAEDLLDVTRISTGTLELTGACVDVAVLVERASTALARTIEAREQTLVVEAPADPVAIDVDARRVVQVVVNLISNAASSTPPGGTITLSWGREYGHAFLEVRGGGMPAPVLERMFEITGGRLNLGLALAKQLVELHRGTLRATTAGVFEIRLPAAEFPLDAIRSRLVTARQRALARPRVLRVLIVDDDEDFGELTAALLTGRGHQVTRALEARTALSLLAEHRPDVALIDLELPMLDGCELVRLARTIDPPLPTRFIAMADGTTERVSGFAGHLVRPIVSSSIVLALEAE
jgi:CheY-like chemotaxis protein